MQVRVRQYFELSFPRLKRILIGCGILLFIFVVIFLVKLSSVYQISPLVLWQLARADSGELKQTVSRTNIVLLGVGGVNHEGADMTDTIIVVSIGIQTKDIVMISVPRDIWVASFKDKINAAYHYGESKSSGGGFVLAKSAVEEIVGIPIHYAAMIDFAGFEQLIDTLGGVDIEVEKSFTDSQYPIMGKENDLCDGDPTYACRYETISFNQGLTHMNGEQALKYVRSRHAESDAGNDFSRGQRQRAVLLAIKNKVFTSSVITDRSLLQQLFKDTSKAIKTDMSLAQELLLGRQLVRSQGSIRSTALIQDEPEKDIKGLLIHPPLWEYGGAWVLTPKHGDYVQIGKYIDCFIQNKNTCDILLD